MKTNRHYIGAAMKYSLLPGIVPRIIDFFSSGFAHMAFFMAQIYRAVNLLPAGHPYLAYGNKGRYGIWNVIAEARRHLVFKASHIDQILVFISLLVGVVLLLLQFAMLLMAVIVPPALATGAHWARFLANDTPEDDLAFLTLDRVFGVPRIFNSRVSTGDEGVFPSQFHDGLHELFSYYSIGVFMIAVIIIIYYVITIVAETAVSGSPFGRRFHSLWAPIRLILAIGLLAPISYGMNIAQITTLHVAKWGSNLATNSWITFNTAIEESTILGDADNLIAQPVPPALNTYLEWIMTAHTCIHMYSMMYDQDIQFYVVRTRPTNSTAPAEYLPLQGTSYADARAISDSGTITIVAGEHDPAYTDQRANIKPICGTMTLEVVDEQNAGAVSLQESYYGLVQLEATPDFTLSLYGRAIAERFAPTVEKDPNAVIPTPEYLKGFSNYHASSINGYINAARALQQEESNWLVEARELGWAGAGMWYNKVAQYNGTLFTAVYNLPTPQTYPEVMEYTRQQRLATDQSVAPGDRYRPYRNDGNPIEYYRPGEFYVAQALYFVHTLWEDNYIPASQNQIIDMIHLIFGTTGLFDMRQNIDLGIHPMAAIVGIGSSLIESTVLNIGAFAIGSIIGGVGKFSQNDILASTGQVISGLSMQLAVLGLTVGFILFYVIPFLPFIFFFFAFSGWAKAVFEAMVGLPLWALAFLRIDGEGPMGAAAQDGLFLVFEIFIRPVVIIFALIASVTIFSAMVNVLNNVWDLVLTNLTGHTVSGDGPDATEITLTGVLAAARGTVDKLFYTVIYAIFVYLIGMSSFKLIDLVPNYTLRWVGKEIMTFGEGDLSEQAGQNLIGMMQKGSMAATMQFSASGQSMMAMLMGRNS